MSVGILGALLVKISFFAGLSASVLYYLQHDKPARNLVGVARSAYYGAVLTLLAAGATLLVDAVAPPGRRPRAAGVELVAIGGQHQREVRVRMPGHDGEAHLSGARPPEATERPLGGRDRT